MSMNQLQHSINNIQMNLDRVYNQVQKLTQSVYYNGFIVECPSAGIQIGGLEGTCYGARQIATPQKPIDNIYCKEIQIGEGTIYIDGDNILFSEFGSPFITSNAPTESVIIGENLEVVNNLIVGNEFESSGTIIFNKAFGSVVETKLLSVTEEAVMEGSIVMIGNTNVFGDFNVSGSTNLKGTTEVGGQLTVDGLLQVAGGAEIVGDLVVSGEAFLNGDTNIQGDMDVMGNAEINGYIEIDGYAKVIGEMLVGGDIFVSGGALINGGIEVIGEMSVGGDLLVSGDAQINGGIEVIGEMSVGGDLLVSGDAQINGGIEVLGGMSVSGDLLVSGTLVSYGGASGGAFFYGDMNVSGGAQIEGEINVLGYAQILGGMQVSGDLLVSGTLVTYGGASGGAFFYGDTTIVGSESGTALEVFGGASGSAAAYIEGNTTVVGSVSGTALEVFGGASGSAAAYIEGNTTVVGSESGTALEVFGGASGSAAFFEGDMTVLGQTFVSGISIVQGVGTSYLGGSSAFFTATNQTNPRVIIDPDGLVGDVSGSGPLLIYNTLDGSGSFGYYSSFGGGSWATSSDKRLKSDVENLSETDENFFYKLQPKKFNINSFGEYGFIAQDIYHATDFDDKHQHCILRNYENYNENDPNSPYLSIAPTMIIPLLVQAVQNQEKDIQLLKAEVESIKSKLA